MASFQITTHQTFYMKNLIDYLTMFGMFSVGATASFELANNPKTLLSFMVEFFTSSARLKINAFWKSGDLRCRLSPPTTFKWLN